MVSPFISEDRQLCRFLQVSGNSWHNALYISCGNCQRAAARRCRDLLCVFDDNAIPVFIPVQDAEQLWHTRIDQADCLAEIRRDVFVALYGPWLFRHLAAPSACPLAGLCREEDLPPSQKSPIFPNL